MTLSPVSLGDPHVAAHNAERSSINALIEATAPLEGSVDLGLVARAQNVTGQPVSFGGTPIVVPYTTIITPPTTRPLKLSAQAAMQLTAGPVGNNGFLMLMLYEITTGSPVIQESFMHPVQAGDPNTGGFTLGGSFYAPPSNTERVFYLGASTNKNGGTSYPTAQVTNYLSFQSTWLQAEVI